MIVTWFIVITMAICCQATKLIADPTFSVTGPTCSTLNYYPGVEQFVTMTVEITNDGTEVLPAGDNFEVLFYVYPIPDSVSGHVNQQTDGDATGGGYMQLPESLFAEITNSFSDAIPSMGTIAVTGKVNIVMPSDYCDNYTKLCVSLRLTATGEAAGAGMGEQGTDNQNGGCVDFGCTGTAIGKLVCEGPDDSSATSTTLSLMAAVLWGVLIKLV